VRTGAWAWLGVVLLIATPASAEVRRLEVVGAVPAGADAPAGVPVRQAALQQALVEAVARVAQDLWQKNPQRPVQASGGPAGSLGAGPPQAPAPDPTGWVALLGGDAASYTVRYRVLEDRGVQRALLVRDPKVASEYELLVEVQVDASRVAEALERAGLLSAQRMGAARQLVRIELTPLPSYAALQAIRERLSVESGQPVTPERFTADAVVLQVDSAASPDVLLERLLSKPPQGLRVRPLAVEAHTLRLQVVEERPSGADAIDTP